ncbi:hypothetical protein EEB14_35080 [Rhodococcus sp. WS4]|nr:hypothetical protein EEB14_35080 [Rhodococcus sp. WS4]
MSSPRCPGSSATTPSSPIGTSSPGIKVTSLIELIATVAARHSLKIGVFGRTGDGHVHPTIIYDEDDPVSRQAALTAFHNITCCALDLGGTATGESGVGRLKKRWLANELGDIAISAHHAAVKNAFDPLNLLNPSAMFDHAPAHPNEN